MRILGIDYGDARTGFAVCDPTGMLASAVETFHSHKMEEVAQRTAEHAQAYQAEELVLGFPKNMNNTQGPRAEKTLELKARLEELLPDTPIVLWDERSTTVSAIRILNETNTRGKKRKNVVDSVAAVLILESYLAYRRSHEK
ncbi:MAG: Holliday junction resolvase RuvX [Eubacteriales bacterium]|jgi:putative Holliday junction resolvase